VLIVFSYVFLFGGLVEFLVVWKIRSEFKTEIVIDAP